jgi:hypothetical protein
MQNKQHSKVIYLLPALHFAACLVIVVLRLSSGWEFLLKVDYPMSVVIITAIFSFDHPFIVFGTLGTLWWYILSRAAFMLVAVLRRSRSPGSNGS